MPMAPSLRSLRLRQREAEVLIEMSPQMRREKAKEEPSYALPEELQLLTAQRIRPPMPPSRRPRLRSTHSPSGPTTGCSWPDGSSPIPTSSTRRQARSEEHTSELQSHHDLVCRLLLEKKKKKI